MPAYCSVSENGSFSRIDPRSGGTLAHFQVTRNHSCVKISSPSFIKRTIPSGLEEEHDFE
jgi:hypothetical protein